MIGIWAVISYVITLNKFDFQSHQDPRGFFSEIHVWPYDIAKISYFDYPMEYAHLHDIFKDIDI